MSDPIVIDQPDQVKVGDVLRWRNTKSKRLLLQQYRVDRVCKGRKSWEWWVMVDVNKGYEYQGGPYESNPRLYEGQWEIWETSK